MAINNIINDQWQGHSHGEVEDALKALLAQMLQDIEVAGIPAGGVTADMLAQSLQTLINGKYSKPGTGIPASDLAQAVQTVLTNAVQGVKDHNGNLLTPVNGVVTLPESEGGDVTVDASMSSTSENAVQNKVIKAYVDTAIAALVNGAPAALDTLKELADALGDDSDAISALTNAIAAKANAADLASVATSGSYNDLSNKPTIPTVDSTPTQNSTNAVQSGAVYTALAGKLGTGDVSVETPSTADGTFTVNVGSNSYTVNLNHTHENMAKVVMCEESDLPSSLDANTIYVQVDDDESPTEIEKLYICGLEFSAGEPNTTPRLISPSASIELDFNGASTLEVVVRGTYLTQALTITASGDFTVTANNSSVSSISANDANTGVTLTLTKGSNFVGGTLAISSTEVSRTLTVKSPLPEGFIANKAWNDTTLIDATGYCISPVIAVSSNHTFEIKFGFVRGETQYGCAAGFQSNLSNGSAEVNVWASTDPRQSTIAYGWLCGTFKISEIDDCYIKDVTSNTYVWKGKNVT